MQKMKVVIIGAGGHGKVVADALLKENKFELAGFADDNRPTGEKVFMDYKVIGRSADTDLIKQAEGFVLAIGNNQIRAEKFNSLKLKMKPVTIIHPNSSIALDVKIGSGTVVLAGAVINSAVMIGDNCIVNSHCLIDHDCVIMDHSHIGQTVSLGSGNKVDSFTHFKQGAVIGTVL